MNVELVTYTQNPEETIEKVARFATAQKKKQLKVV